MTNYLSSSDIYKEVHLINDEAMKKFIHRQNLIKQWGKQLDGCIHPPHVSNADMYIFIDRVRNELKLNNLNMKYLLKYGYYHDLIYGARSLDEQCKILSDMRQYDQYGTINLDSYIKEHEEVIRKLVENRS